MTYFVMFSLVPVIFVIAVVLGIVTAVTRNMSDSGRRTAKVVTSAVLGIGTVIYFYLVVLIIDAHFDTEDLFSPSDKAKLQEWGEACEGPVGPGRSLSEVVSYLDETGVVIPEDLGMSSNTGQQTRKFARYTEFGDYQRVVVIDSNVRNQNFRGDLDAVTTITLVDGAVDQCSVAIDRHGR